MSAIVVGRGRNQITVGPELAAMVQRVLDQSAPEIAKQLDETISTIRGNAESRWPVGKEHKGKLAGRPHSRDMMQQGIRIVDANTIEAFLFNPAPYAYKIKSHQNSLDGRSPFQELMRKPAIAAGEQLAATLGHVLGEIAEGRNG